MRLLLGLIFGGVLAWQATAAALELGRRIAFRASVDYRLRLLADTDTRIRATLGGDAAIYAAVRELVPASGWVLTRKVDGAIDDLLALAAKQGAIQQLSNLLYPGQLLFSVPDPIALVEAKATAGPQPRWPGAHRG